MLGYQASYWVIIIINIAISTSYLSPHIQCAFMENLLSIPTTHARYIQIIETLSGSTITTFFWSSLSSIFYSLSGKLSIRSSSCLKMRFWQNIEDERQCYRGQKVLTFEPAWQQWLFPIVFKNGVRNYKVLYEKRWNYGKYKNSYCRFSVCQNWTLFYDISVPH